VKNRHWTQEDSPKTIAASDSLGCGHDRHGCSQSRMVKRLTAVAEYEGSGLKSLEI
jgi:hypothetical protein